MLIISISIIMMLIIIQDKNLESILMLTLIRDLRQHILKTRISKILLIICNKITSQEGIQNSPINMKVTKSTAILQIRFQLLNFILPNKERHIIPQNSKI